MTGPAVVRALPEQQRAFESASRGAPAVAVPLAGFTPAAIWGDYTPPGYLVRDIIGQGELAVLFGQSGHFKSVIAIDLALSLGMGVAFHGFATRRAGVLYVAGEGHHGLRKRARAWMLSRGLDATGEQPAVFFTTAAGDLISGLGQLQETATAAARELAMEIGLVVIDTLAANFGAGDENHASDMALAIGNARAAAPGAAVLVVHHSGHGTDARERGSSALAATGDCRMCAVYDEASRIVELKQLKNKDDERIAPIEFAWRAVDLEWTDADGQPLTSVVLDRITSDAPSTRSDRPLGSNQQTALKVLRRLYAARRRNVEDRGDDPETASVMVDGWRAECVKAGLGRNRWKEVFDSLIADGLVVIDGPHAQLSERPK